MHVDVTIDTRLGSDEQFDAVPDQGKGGLFGFLPILQGSPDDLFKIARSNGLLADLMRKRRLRRAPAGFAQAIEHVLVVLQPKPGRAFADVSQK
jgi:hypothetical protein